MASIIITKSKEFPNLDKKMVALIIRYVQFAADHLELPKDKDIKIKFLHSAPNERITTGAFSPATKQIMTIAQNRHYIDYMRTVAHEMTHLKQHYDGKIEGNTQEIGGDIENEANVEAGIITKSFLKTKLSQEDKKFLGLGTY